MSMFTKILLGVIAALVVALPIVGLVGRRRGFKVGYKAGVVMAVKACREGGGNIDIDDVPRRPRKIFPNLNIFRDVPPVTATPIEPIPMQDEPNVAEPEEAEPPAE